jgi:phage terminase large subunit-like protein
MLKPDRSKHKAAYINEMYHRAENYKAQIESGELVSNRWIKAAIVRSRSDEARKDIYFDSAAVKRVYDFFYYCNISTGESYKRFSLTPYQAWILSEIFGWYYTNQERKRRFRYVLLYTARKSGKTVFFCYHTISNIN